MKTHCINCKEEFSESNVFTDAGKSETQITGYCEICFDNIFTISQLDDFLFECGVDNDEETEVDFSLSAQILRLVKKYSGKVYLAGGFWRQPFDGLLYSDIDLFFNDLEALEDVKNGLDTLGYTQVFECPVGSLHSFKNDDGIKVQLITQKEYESLEELVDSFDIIACCCGWDGTRFYHHDKFASDCNNRLVGLNTVTHPAATFKRMMKYKDKGYTIPNTTIESYLHHVVNLSEGDYSLLDGRFYID